MSIETLLSLDLDGGQAAFEPGDTLAGSLGWSTSGTLKWIEVRLIWLTRGKGTQDVAVVDVVRWDAPAGRERREFSFALPPGPYSFSGRLVSLVWAVEAVAEPGNVATRTEVTIAPQGREIQLVAPTP